MDIQASFSSFTIDKKILIEKLNENKAIHLEHYENARQFYLQAKLEYLNLLQGSIASKVKRAQNGEDVSLHSDIQMNMVEPISHELDYNNAIKMLELTNADSVTLTSQEFNKYILNDWTQYRPTNSSCTTCGQNGD